MKISADKKQNQTNLLQEFYKAQEKEFVTNMEMELEHKTGKIIYEPTWQMYRNELTDIHAVSSETVLDCPTYVKLDVTFCSSVDTKKLHKIAKYASEKYGCKSSIVNNKISFFGFDS